MSDSDMVIRADARAMGAVTALDTRVSPRWNASRASARTFGGVPFTGTSECISYAPDGTASVFTPRTRKPNRTRARIAQENTRQSYAERVAQLGAIGDTN